MGRGDWVVGATRNMLGAIVLVVLLAVAAVGFATRPTDGAQDRYVLVVAGLTAIEAYLFGVGGRVARLLFAVFGLLTILGAAGFFFG